MTTIKFRNTLTINLLLMIVISFFGTLAVMIFFAKMDIFINPNGDVLQAGLLLTFWFFIIIITFIVIFSLLVRKKIRYLRNITETVQQIANGKLGLTIDIKGKDELSQLAQNINFMSKELENKFIHERKLEKVKNELITNISHDLRTPLTSIIGYLNLIKNGQYENKDQRQEYFETIYSKAHRLKLLINELFEFSRLSSPDVQLTLSEVDLPSVLQQIIGEYTPIFEKEQLYVQKSITDEIIPVLMDVEKMVRVYENLFINAMKYSVKRSDIRISFDTLDNIAILKVSNRIENPPVEDVNKLFERFFRGDKARNDAQGTGLGLSISKRIVDLHNGKIHAEYKDGWILFIVEHPILQK